MSRRRMYHIEGMLGRAAELFFPLFLKLLSALLTPPAVLPRRPPGLPSPLFAPLPPFPPGFFWERLSVMSLLSSTSVMESISLASITSSVVSVTSSSPRSFIRPACGQHFGPVEDLAQTSPAGQHISPQHDLRTSTGTGFASAWAPRTIRTKFLNMLGTPSRPPPLVGCGEIALPVEFAM